MRINIVMGFFLPMPPVRGGATEKSWHRLAGEFARRGHQVTVLTRRWPGWPDRETRDGVNYLRLRGADHGARLVSNLRRDLVWSLRVGRALPAADVTIVNCVALPIWLGRWRNRAGRIVVMTGRMPKGQFRFYGRIDRILAVSSAVQAEVNSENPHLGSRARVVGYPIDAAALSLPRESRLPGAPVTLGFVGRIHREKGLDLLADALGRLAKRKALPPWRVLLCGPQTVPEGGSGEAYVSRLRQTLHAGLPPGTWELRPPLYGEGELGAFYRQIDVFCYPSLAVTGETFGVAVAEAMAAGAVPVVSSLPCFADFVHPGIDGEIFAANGRGPAAALEEILAGLLADPDRRARLAAEAARSVAPYDLPAFASRLLADFSILCPAS